MQRAGETIIELGDNAAANEAISIDASGFEGSAQQLSTSPGKLLIQPRSALPSEILVKQNNSIVEKLRILPVALGSEEGTIQNDTPAPDSLSRDYTNFTQLTVPFDAQFNGARKATLRQIKISGHQILVMPGSKQGIYERLMPSGAPAKDIQSVDIYAKNVIIAAPLELPGTTVRIYAESLEFRDAGPQPSLIKTTPASQPPSTRPGQAGGRGEKGGDVYLYLRNPVITQNPGPVRFVLSGGAGQQGGPESKGPTGASRPEMPKEPQIGGIQRSWTSIPKVVHGSLPPQWGADYNATGNVIWFKRGGNFEFGADTALTGNGGPGVAGGAPGVGGQAGSLHSKIPIPGAMVDITGGPPGARRPSGRGGDPGTPNPAVGIWIDERPVCGLPGPFGQPARCSNQLNAYNFYFYHTSPGPDTPSPTSSKGPDGTIAAYRRLAALIGCPSLARICRRSLPDRSLRRCERRAYLAVYYPH